MESENLVKEVNSLCLQTIIKKQKACKCRIKACFHAGQMDLALKVLVKTGINLVRVRDLLLKNDIKSNEGNP